MSQPAAIEVRSPYDGAPVGSVPCSGPEAVERALGTAYRLFRDRAGWLSPARRIEILTATAALMERDAEALAVQAAREGGKPLTDSRVEVARAIDGVRTCCELLRGEAGRVVPMNLNAASADRVAFTQAEPIGVVVAISAFNHPLNLIVHQVAPAIAAGCPVVVKPASATPLSCFGFVALLREAGLPEDWCQALALESDELAGRLAADPRVGFLSFIGSARVGWSLRAKLAPGARCALEHGGAAPVIVAADADLDLTVGALARGGFYHAGQVCVSVQRVFVHVSIAEELAKRLAGCAGALKVGDPLSPGTEVGPLIRAGEVERVHAWVGEAVAGGGALVGGGQPLSETCYPPTVVFEPPADCRLSREEVFGPVVAVYGYHDIEDAFARANALPWAFQAAVFTRDYATAMRAYRGLDASAVMLNDHTAFRVDWMPFAGLRRSGLGVGGIPYTFHEMRVEKMFVGPMP
ncbi:aldehyde dehydrogenase family protein [Amaricoccus sp. W119]|uniref:aldehyde dehydrogenase family protein n=1 Tax=Amaricoccus sp. W119 TaxID=3391833 RepID=UPI0039A6EDCB